MKLYPSPDPRPEAERAAKVANCQAALYDILALRYFAHLAHWNVRGPNRQELHKLFGEVYDAADGLADRMAERIVMLGGVALGTPTQVAEESTLDDYPANMVDGQQHVREIAARLTDANVTLQGCMRRADDDGDENGYQIINEASIELEALGGHLMAHLA